MIPKHAGYLNDKEVPVDKRVGFHPRGQVVFGIIIILLGAVFLLDNVIDINLSAFFWPLLLIGLGIFVLLRPGMVERDTAVTQRFIAEFDRDGEWDVQSEEFQSFIADATLDLTKANLPEGVTKFRFMNFVGDIELIVPESVGVSVQSSAFVSELKVNGRKEESFLSPLTMQTEDYKVASSKIRIEATGFVNEIKVRRV